MLPSVLKNTKFNVLADFVAEKLAVLREKTAKLDILNIEEVSPKFLDLLAWQFHVDFWRSDLPIESKRELIKNSIKWHRYKGTPWAVKKLLEAVGVKGEVVEWFQEGADLGPYEFGVRCWIERPLSSKELYGPDTVDDIKKIISVAKNARSWLAWISIAISFDIELKTAIDSLSLVQNKHRLNFSLYPLFDLIACDTTLLDLSPIENTQSITDKFLCQFSLGQEWTLDSYVGFLLDAQMCGTEGEFREAGSFMRRLIDFYVPFWFEGENYLKSKNFWDVECSFEISAYTSITDKFLCQFSLGQEWTLDSYVGFLLDAQMCGTEGEFREAGSFMRRLVDFYAPLWFKGENYLKSKNFWDVECSFETSAYTTSKRNIGVEWEQGQTGLDHLPAFDQLALDFAPLDSFMEV